MSMSLVKTLTPFLVSALYIILISLICIAFGSIVYAVARGIPFFEALIVFPMLVLFGVAMVIPAIVLSSLMWAAYSLLFIRQNKFYFLAVGGVTGSAAMIPFLLNATTPEGKDSALAFLISGMLAGILGNALITLLNKRGI